MSGSFCGNWNYPTAVWFGAGRIRELPAACAEQGIRRPLVVTDRGLMGLPMIGQIRGVLEEAGLPAEFFGDVQGNPTGADVDAGLARFRAGGHDGVVALGGGSALDVGKAVGLMAGQKRPLWDFEDRADWWTRVDVEVMAPVVAVPTTSGTGSEVGRCSVIVHAESHTKRIIFHPRMLPARVICDPALTVGLPAHLTAATGVDALSHSLEAFCAPGFHPQADGIALQGMSLVRRALPRASADGGDLEARAEMMAAALMGATAFQKGLGAMHALSHPIGAVVGAHHGLTNAVVMPYVLAWNRAEITAKMAHLARVLALPERGPTAVIEWVLALRAELGIPHTLGEIGVTEALISQLAAAAVVDPTAATNPRPVTEQGARELLECALEGRLP